MYSGMYYYCVHISSHSTTVDSAAICYLDAASNQVMSSRLHHSEELDLSGNALSDHAACQSSIWQNPAASDSGKPQILLSVRWIEFLDGAWVALT